MPPVQADQTADRLTLAVDALTRLPGDTLDAQPALKDRILGVLEKTRGTPNFIRLVQHFHIAGQETGLLELAVKSPREESGVEALRLVLASKKTAPIAGILAQGGSNAIALAEALGNTGQRDSAELLTPFLTSPKAEPELRAQAIRSLARTLEGARDLLAAVRAHKLSGENEKLAITELAQARWDEISRAAAGLRGSRTAALPPLSELVRRPGDAGNGARIFQRASPGCASCHIVNGRGADLGPNLSEIGSKLAKEAIYQAILEPSAGISFGFEGYTLGLKDGDEAYGIIASETADEIVLKAVGGVASRYKKSDVVSRQKSTLSIMPAGLEAGMTPQELVDLVEFLSSLRKRE